MRAEDVAHAKIVWGAMALVSVGLAALVSPYWTIVAALVGVDLVQSVLTRWSPVETLVAKRSERHPLGAVRLPGGRVLRVIEGSRGKAPRRKAYRTSAPRASA